MWYVIQVYSGREQYCIGLMTKYINRNIYTKCYCPEYIQMKKIAGRWEEETKTLFPGYIFVQTDRVKELFFELKNIPRMTKLIGNGNDIIPLTYEEEQLLYQITGEQKIIGMSMGIIHEGNVIILSGPLIGREKYIKKIDRHKREALLEATMFQRRQVIRVGLEIVDKS